MSQSLQFGHGGEAVENIDIGRVDADVRSLQFGHGGEAVENRRRQSWTQRSQCPTSIRPRR